MYQEIQFDFPKIGLAKAYSLVTGFSPFVGPTIGFSGLARLHSGRLAAPQDRNSPAARA
jgi:hypothetical protein